MGGIAALLESWWNSLTPGTREQVVGGLIVAFIIGAISFLGKVLTAIGCRIRRNPSIQPSQQEWRSTPTDRDEQLQRRNLSMMSKTVRRLWIEGVLDKSLYKEVLIQLNMAERADAVDNRPWNLMLHQPDEASQLLPPSTRILDVFDQMEQRLLILGEPGSGKTTTLLELTRDLLKRADQDSAQPTPVVFNLSSWGLRRSPLDEWLVEEFRTRYRIPKNIAQDWIRHNDLILLLDGLDEVEELHREACIIAINDFRQQHLMPLVVCSRMTEYDRLSQQLKLGGAVLLQPLSPKQIQEYFDRAGESLSSLRDAVRQDMGLQEMAESPLLLSIMTLAYQGASAAEVNTLETTVTRRQHLFDTYIARMFVRRELKLLFTPSKTLGWLRWLAQRMTQYGQTTFLVKGMQPSWLNPSKTKTWAAYAQATFWVLHGLIFWLIYCLIFGLISGLYIGLGVTLIDLLIGGLNGGITDELMFGMIGGLVGGMIGGLIVGLIVGLVFEPFSQFVLRHEGTTQAPSRADRLAMRYAFISGVVAILIVGVLGGVIVRLIGELSDELMFGMIGGLVGGVIGGVIGVADNDMIIKNYMLRLALWLKGDTPFNYVRFLDYAAALTFLRKADGGYIFIHRLVMVHFSRLSDSDILRIVSAIPKQPARKG